MKTEGILVKLPRAISDVKELTNEEWEKIRLELGLKDNGKLSEFIKSEDSVPYLAKKEGEDKGDIIVFPKEEEWEEIRRELGLGNNIKE